MQKCRLPGVGKRRVRHPESGMPAVRRSDAAEHEAFAAASEQSESAGKKLKPGLRQVPPEAPLPAVFFVGMPDLPRLPCARPGLVRQQDQARPEGASPFMINSIVASRSSSSFHRPPLCWPMNVRAST